MPSLSVTLLDATRKKISFLNHVVRRLTLNDICAMHIRVEDWMKDVKPRQFFDVITCRAFSDLKHFVINALPLVKPDGVLIALKGKEAQTELNQMTILDDGDLRMDLDGNRESGVSLRVEVSKWSLPYLHENRVLIVLRR
jgi:16S rRNA (guanine527-N7)-methyltransferase